MMGGTWCITRGWGRTFTFCIWGASRSEEHTSELQSLTNIVCRLLLEKKKTTTDTLRALIDAVPMTHYRARYTRGRMKDAVYLAMMMTLWSSLLVTVYTCKILFGRQVA